MALRLRDSKAGGDTAEMVATVRVNWRLWTIIQSDLLDPECLVPDDVRVNVLSLAQFVDKHTVDLIADPGPEKLDILIAINRELAGGLYTTPSAKEKEGEGGATVGDGSEQFAKTAVAVSA